jgi:predicted small secreted protein
MKKLALFLALVLSGCNTAGGYYGKGVDLGGRPGAVLCATSARSYALVASAAACRGLGGNPTK